MKYKKQNIKKHIKNKYPYKLYMLWYYCKLQATKNKSDWKL